MHTNREQGAADSGPGSVAPELTRLTLHDMAHLGAAVGRADDKVIFAYFGIPGEEVVVAPLQTRAKLDRVAVVDVIRASPYRVKPPCPAPYARTNPAPYRHARKMEQGDLFRIDIYGAYEGYYFDFGRSTVVGGTPTDEQRMVLEAAVGSVQAAIGAIKPGATAGDVATSGTAYLESVGLSLKGAAFPSFGHGQGLGWEIPWLMVGDKTELQAGMYLAVERRLGKQGAGSAGFEENVILTDQGVEILTTSRIRWW